MYPIHNPRLFLTRSENQFNFGKLITACYCTTDARNNTTTIIPAVNAGIAILWKVIQCTIRILCSFSRKRCIFDLGIQYFCDIWGCHTC